MKISAAQIRPVEHNTHSNIQTHLKMIELAAKQNVELIVFPEMSLTGYEREMAEQLAFTVNDFRLNVFRDKAEEYKMLIVVGAPIKIESTLYIGSFVFLPDGTTSIYTKQFLHDGEEKYFAPSCNYNPLIEFKNENISIAICADINNPLHPKQAYNRKTTLYLPSIFYTTNGIAEGHTTLGRYAKEYSMKVLMANYAGSSYGLEAGGKSGFWNNEGDLVKQLDSKEENLLIVEI
jgi:predicted amidohydrolase